MEYIRTLFGDAKSEPAQLFDSLRLLMLKSQRYSVLPIVSRVALRKLRMCTGVDGT